MEAQKITGFLKNAYYQGHGRYVNQIARLTLKLCKTSGSSRELRKFVETDLVDLAKASPGCVIYIKPRLFRGPVMTADFLNGQTHWLNLHRMNKEQIGAWIDWFLTRSGYDLCKLLKPINTYHPTIQGFWSPFANTNPRWTTLELPSEEFSTYKPDVPTATDQLLTIARTYGFKEPEPWTEGDLKEILHTQNSGERPTSRRV